MTSKPFKRRFRQVCYLAACVVLLGAVAQTVPLDVLKQAMSVLASAVWGS